MTDDRIEGRLSDLITGITGDAEVFGYSPERLARRLDRIATDYVAAIAIHAASPTRGAVLKDLDYVSQGDREGLSRRIGILGDEALSAAVGTYPGSGMKLQGIDDYEDVVVPDKAELGIAAIKKMIAVRSRKKAPILFKAESRHTGLEQYWSKDQATIRQRLQRLAANLPDAVSAAFMRTENMLKETFQLGDGAEGRNAKVDAGFVPPPDWQLMNRIVDLIWPIEKGQMHSSRMRHVRNIIEQTIIYATDETKIATQDARLGASRLIVLGDEDNDRDRRYRFSETWFSTVLTYRHQVDTLRRAVKFVELRKILLQKVPYPAPESVRVRLERLDRLAFYPLLDWRRELERRLGEADYRTANESLRRPTGGVFGLPDVPRIKRDTPQAIVALKLIHAWRDYKGKKEPPNKGKPMKKTSASKKAPKPGKHQKFPLKTDS